MMDVQTTLMVESYSTSGGKVTLTHEVKAPGDEFDLLLHELRHGNCESRAITVSPPGIRSRPIRVDASAYEQTVSPFHAAGAIGSFRLEFLDLSPGAAALLADGIAGSNFNEFEMVQCCASPDSWRGVFRAIETNCYIQRMLFNCCELGDQGVVGALASSLHANASIHDLGIYVDEIGAAEASALASNESLRDLALSACNIGPCCARSLASAIMRRKSALETLELSQNKMGDEGAIALAQLLEGQMSKISLDLCEIGPDSAQTIAHALKQRTAPLKSLDLGQNPIKNEGAEVFANLLRSGNFVTDLYLHHCEIGIAGCTSLRDALLTNHYLQYVGDARYGLLNDREGEEVKGEEKDRILGDIRHLLELNEKGPLIAEIGKSGVFPHRLLQSLGSELFPHAVEGVKRIAVDVRPLSALFTFVRECLVLFEESSWTDSRRKRKRGRRASTGEKYLNGSV